MKNVSRRISITKTLTAAVWSVLLLIAAGCGNLADNPQDTDNMSPLAQMTSDRAADPSLPDIDITAPISSSVSEPEKSVENTSPEIQTAEITEEETAQEITTPEPPETTDAPVTTDTPETAYVPVTTAAPEPPVPPVNTGTTPAATTAVPGPAGTDPKTPVTTAEPAPGKIPGIPDPPPVGEPDFTGHVHVWEIRYSLRSSYDCSCGSPREACYYCEGCRRTEGEHFTVPAAEHSYKNGRCIYCLKHDESYFASQGLTYAKNADGTYSVTGMSAGFPYDVIVLPAEHNGAPVTAVADGAFAGCTALKGVVFIGTQDGEIRLGEPECRVVKIGDHAFDGCTSLTSFAFPKTLEEIGSYAFRNTKLTQIRPECALRRLGSYAFYGTSLTRVFFEDLRITEFEPYTFAESAIEELWAPATVTKTDAHAFENCQKLKSILKLPIQESFGDYAFAGCTALEFVQRVDTANTVIGKDAFLNCTAFHVPDMDPVTGLAYTETTALVLDPATGIKTEQPVAVISGRGRWKGSDLVVPEKINGLPVYGCEGFSNDAELKSVVFPEGFNSVSMSSFQYCSNLTSVVLPESTRIIGQNCFIGCRSLTSVVLKNADAEIEKGAFDGVEGFETAYDADGLIYRLSADGSSYFVYSFRGRSDESKNLVIPSVHKGLPVTSIYREAFGSARGLAGVTIPESVTDIGENAFAYAKIAVVNLPKNLKSIPDGCFSGNSALERITLPEGLESIGSSAFGECQVLMNPVIPDSVKVVGSYAFEGCSSLTEMPVGRGMTKIPKRYVQNCVSIVKITVPAWINEIDRTAFSWTAKEIVYENPDAVLTGECGEGEYLTWIPGIDYICDESSGVRMYIADDGAHIAGIVPDAAQIVTIPAFCNGVPVVAIDDYAFRNVRIFVSDKKYIIPDSVKSLGKEVFSGSNIREIDLGSLKEVPAN